MTRFFFTLLACCLATFATAQTHPQAESKRFLRGAGNPTHFQSFVIPLDSQAGVPLDPTGDNAAKFPDKPWFTRLINPDSLHLTVTGTNASYDEASTNPLPASNVNRKAIDVWLS